ncbi:cytochrome P450 [Favolaschia claudopus]|uniref:Cytochrome P450 n=1 Tax=Favolaschia claudopus TaxID=2862362 RepID=A0AAW0CXG6_9AGAR
MPTSTCLWLRAEGIWISINRIPFPPRSFKYLPRTRVCSMNVERILNILRSALRPIDAGILLSSGVLCYLLFRRVRSRRYTSLRGPWSFNLLFGVLPKILGADDPGDVYEEWASRYGSVFSVPAALGSRRVVITDPKTLAHFAARETYGYIGTPQSKRFQEKIIGKGLFWAEGDSHKRQRRALNPAFTNAAIKNLTSIFFDSAYKAKAAWDATLESGPQEGTIIEVQLWMNHISLDTIGLAGFSHDFGTLSGKTSTIATVFDSLGSKISFFDTVTLLLSFIFPIFARIPTPRRMMLNDLGKTMQSLGDRFLHTNTADSIRSDTLSGDKSVIGLLVKSASTEKISHDEVAAQINVLLIAGYETTSISLTWALIELSRNPDMQTKLRNEILSWGRDRDPTWEELTAQGTFLDAFTCEILRVHPPLPELHRMAAEDDILPLTEPLMDAHGKQVESVFVEKGTVVTLPIQCINRSEAFWGPDAKVFNPARWLDESHGVNQHRAQEIQGYRHMLTFSDGARICLGKVFAVTEFKAVLSVLLRHFIFELPRGPDTVIGRHRNLLPRPKVEGEAGYEVPLRVRHYVGTE